MRFLIAILFVAAAQCQNRPGGYVHDPSGDDGEPYVHDPAWDLTPFQLFQLKKKGVSPQSLSQNSIIQPAAPSQPKYTQQPYQSSYQAAAPSYQAAAPSYQAAPQTADYIAQATRHPDPNFWSRAYAYTAPKYAAKAEGSSYAYEAIF